MWRKRKEIIPDSERQIVDSQRARKRTMDRAVRLLAAKPRSINELRGRLLEKPWTNGEIVDSVIAKLAEYKYVDDKQYAVDLAVSRLRQKPQGKRRLEHTLAQKKLDKDIVTEAVAAAFEKMPETELLDRAIERRIDLKGFPASREEIKRFYDHLMRRGFSYDKIRERLRSMTSARGSE